MKKASNTKPYNTIKSTSVLYSTEISNPNLIINSDFNINQRAQDSYASNNEYIYGFDRWLFYNATVSQLASGGITFSTATGSVYKRIIQLSEIQWKKGQKYTISIKAKVNSITGNILFRAATNFSPISVSAGSASRTITSATNDYVIFSTSFVPNQTYIRASVEVLCVPTSFVNMEIAWVKAEVGAVTTVFSSPLIAEELSKCERYYKSSSRIYATTNYQGNLDAFISFPTTMRIAPSVTVYDLASTPASGHVYIYSGGQFYSVACTVNGYTDGLRITATNTGFSNATVVFTYTASSEIT